MIGRRLGHCLASAGIERPAWPDGSNPSLWPRTQSGCLPQSGPGGFLPPTLGCAVMAEQHHPVRHHHKKFNPANAIEGLGVVIVGALGLLMLIGLLTASGKPGW